MRVLSLVLLGCPATEPAEDCTPFDAGCERMAEVCCGDDYACAYVLDDGSRFECDGSNCTPAAMALVCAACDFEATAYNGCP